MFSSIYVLGLRLLTMGSKFILLAALARYGDLDQVGSFTLSVAVVTLAQLALGYEFYNHWARKFAHSETTLQTALQKSIPFYIASYLVVIPLALIYIYNSPLSSYLPWILALIVTEHLAQELYRAKVFSAQPIMAQSLLFLRNGVWAYVVVGLIITRSIEANVETIWKAWITSAVIAITITIITDKRLRIDVLRLKYDKKWLTDGIKSSSLYAVSMILVMLTQYADVFIINHFMGTYELGIYAIYIAIARAAINLVSSSVTSIYTPIMLKDRQNSKVFREFIRKNLFFGTAICLASIILIKPVVIITNNQEYIKALHIFSLLIPGIIFCIIAEIPHLYLYASNQDNKLLTSNACYAFANISLLVILVPEYGLTGAAVAFSLSGFILLALKSIMLLRCR